MARSRSRQPEPPTGFIASAATLPTRTHAEAGKVQPWQTRAWAHYDTVPELRYLSTWIGNAMSRATLHAARREGNKLVPVTDGAARAAMDELFGGPQNHPELLKAIGTHETVAGEAYITARQNDEWNVLASGKVKQTGQGDKAKVTGDFGGNETRVELVPKRDLVIRVWTPHPTDASEADAPTRSNMRTLDQVTSYDMHISAQLTSRLVGAGILFLPSDIQFPTPPNMPEGSSTAQVFQAALTDAMMAAKNSTGGPADSVPMVVTVDAEALEKILHMKFWSELDDAVIEMRTAAIQRFAIGMDVPPSVLMGNSDENHWNAWLSEEATIKVHLEPRLSAFTSALTNQYLRPAIQGETGIGDPNEWFVIADTSEIRVRPNRSEDAVEMWDRGLLSAVPVLRETGFKPEDRMEAEEYKRWLLQRIATGAVTPELTAEALRLLGTDVDPVMVTDSGVQEQPDHIRTDTEIGQDARSAGPPELQPVAASAAPQGTALVAACEMMVFRALERAGNKLKNKHPRTDVSAMPPHEVYQVLSGDESELLDGSWAWSEQMLDGYADEPAAVTATLDFYVRGLLSQQTPYNRDTLRRLLDSQPLEPLSR